MAKYESWTVRALSEAKLCLIIDDVTAAAYLSGNKNNIDESGSEAFSNIVTAIERHETDENLLKVETGDVTLKLDCTKFKATFIFSCILNNTDELLSFWKKIGPFLMDSENESIPDSSGKEIISGIQSQDTRLISGIQSQDTRLISGIQSQDTRLISGIQSQDTRLISGIQSQDTRLNEERSENSIGCAETGSKSHKSDEVSNDSSTQALDDFDLDKATPYDENCDRKDAYTKIMQKSAGLFFLDILKIKDPPNQYRVRSRNEQFIHNLSDIMITKNSVSIDNAPNIIGLVLVDKSNFKKDNIKQYSIYAIDGNHSLYAQRLAYQKTQDPLFKYRSINIYCNLTPEEALLLGISRNEDSANVLKFSDFDKVDLVRRQLYYLANTALEDEPPEPTQEFTSVYRKLLNLKQKTEVDAKAIFRFLATKLSRRCYKIYMEICTKYPLLKASKFEPLRGLDENDQYDMLSSIASSNITSRDWREFKDKCMEKKKTNKISLTEYPTKIEFSINSNATLTVGKSRYLTPCFRFIREGQEICRSSEELQDLIFEKQSQMSRSSSPTVLSGKRMKKSIGCNYNLTGRRSKSSVFVPETDSENDSDECDKAWRMSDDIGNIDAMKTKPEDLQEFIEAMADANSYEKALAGQLIEEEEVETIPNNISTHATVLLNISNQNAAKEYFTEDAWLNVCNTLTALKENYQSFKDENPENFDTKDISKDDSDKFMSRYGKTYNRNTPKQNCSNFDSDGSPSTNGSSSCHTSRRNSGIKRRDVYSFSGSETSSPPKGLGKKQKTLTEIEAAQLPPQVMKEKPEIKECCVRLTDIFAKCAKS